MLVCHGCHRHVRVEESACPFCGAPVRTTAAPAPIKLGAMALVMGLGLFGCATDGDDAGNDGMTSNNPEGSTGTDTGDDPNEEVETSGSDYGGPEAEEGFEEAEEGDGDGDGDTGDGDGDGEGDGDGDGDTTGDGDGDTTGDGDGDEGGSDYGAPPPPKPWD